ncbi:MAG: adenine phosphoribosyltransferase, partial [Actinobacteria bacterium]
MPASHEVLRSLVREISDYPTEGVTFRDITPLLGDAKTFARAIDGLVEEFAGVEVDRVVGV